MIKGRVLIIVRALYGLKMSANAWRTHIYNTLQTKMNSKSSLADNDVWLKQDMRSDGSSYYTYILVYTDGILIVSDNPTQYMAQLKANYYVKESSIGPPNIYLGSRVKLVKDRSGNRVYAAIVPNFQDRNSSIFELTCQILHDIICVPVKRG